MIQFRHFPLFAALFTLFLGGRWACGSTPVPENFPGAADFSGPVTPAIPTAKALILPITAYDPAGGRLSFTAVSSNPHIMVRVRTGDPLLVLNIRHTASPSDPNDLSYSGDAVFQLFRQLTPQTAGFIAGFAQAGFYDGLNFFRLADLNDPQDGTKSLISSNIYQGGDPSGDGTGGPSFTFQTEHDASLIFTGRGQLAMANAGEGTDFRGTNGSQFFITDGRLTLNSDGSINGDGHPRHLDFVHTIFAQMTHGWDMLDNIANTARWPYLPPNADGSAATIPDGQTPDHPKAPVTIASAKIVDQYQPANGPTYTDAVLVLTAKAPETASITVAISDDQTPPNVTNVTFQVRGVVDTHNDKPFLSRLDDQVLAKNKRVDLPFKVVDLERDFVIVNSSITNAGSGSTQTGATQVFTNGLKHTVAVRGNPGFQNTSGPNGYTGPLDVVVAATQFDMSYRGLVDGSARAVDENTPARFAVGEPLFTPQPVAIQGAAGTALSHVVVAKYQTANTRAQAGDITAVINWGDGSVTIPSGTTTPVADFPEDGISPDGASSSRFQVLGTHTYAQKGIYPIQVTFTDNTSNGQTDNGLLEKVLSTAVITDGPLSAVGRTLEIKGRNVENQVIATFTDSDGPGGSYVADIDWGDGLITKGTIRSTPAGVFSILGSHNYPDPETFSVLVHVHKQNDSTHQHDVTAWSTLDVSGFTPAHPHLPPFDQAHLVAEFSPVGNIPTKKSIVKNGVSQTYLSYQLTVLNAGNIPSKRGHVRLYLSVDKFLNLTAQTNADGSVNPADIPLKIGNVLTQLDIPPLDPENAITFSLYQSPRGDFRLTPARPGPAGGLAPLPNGPQAGDLTSGNNIIGVLDYDDPLANNEPIDRAAVVGPLGGVLLDGLIEGAPSLSTSEDGGADSPNHTQSFNVALDRRPTADVNITFTVSDATEGSLSLAIPSPTTAPASSVTVTFNASNWNTKQTVYVTGLPDSSADGAQSYSITADVASADPYFDNLPVSSIQVTNRDSVFVVTPLKLVAYRTLGVSNTATFTVALAQKPTSNVVLPIVPSDATALTVDQSTLTFTPTNGTTAQTVTVTAVDLDMTGDKAYQVKLGPATSNDFRFGQVAPASVTVTSKDDPFLVSATNLPVYRVSNGFSSASFSVALASAPTSNVTIPVVLSSGAPGALSSALLTFTPANYATPQTVTVSATDTAAAGEVPYTLTLGLSSSTDPNYNALPIPPIAVTNTNNPVLVTPIVLTTLEQAGSGHQQTFSVVLAQAPTAPVTIPIASTNTGEGNVDQSSLTFTPANFANPQIVTVTAVDDGTADGNKTYSIKLGPVQSSDATYNGINPPAVSVTNRDAGALP